MKAVQARAAAQTAQAAPLQRGVHHRGEEAASPLALGERSVMPDTRAPPSPPSTRAAHVLCLTAVIL